VERNAALLQELTYNDMSQYQNIYGGEFDESQVLTPEPGD
jgi:hypothetical protein